MSIVIGLSAGLTLHSVLSLNLTDHELDQVINIVPIMCFLPNSASLKIMHDE